MHSSNSKQSNTFRETNQGFRLLTSQIQRGPEIYTYIDAIKLKVIHILNAYLGGVNRGSCLGASGSSRDKVQDHWIHLGNAEKLESACCCQTRTREGELPGVSSRTFWQLLMITIGCP